MNYYVVIRAISKEEAETLAATLLVTELYKLNYKRADTVYYIASDICEDTNKIIALVKD